MSEQPSMFPDITTRIERRRAARTTDPTFTHISMGAGVQSSTIAWLIFEGRLPTPDYAIFADTGWEPKRVYQQLHRINNELLEPRGVQLIRVSDGNIRDDVVDPHSFTRLPLHIRNQDGKPAMLRRSCTAYYKLAPMMRWVRAELGAKTTEIVCKGCGGEGVRAAPWLIKYGGDHTVGRCSICDGAGTVTRVGRVTDHSLWAQSWIGFSVDEMQRCAESPFPYTANWYPLLDDSIRFTREDCENYLAERNWEFVVKSACIGCPFHSNAEWRNIRDDPDEWADAVTFDEHVREISNMLAGRTFLHSSRVPLAVANIDADDGVEHGSCSPHGCRAGDPLHLPLWDDDTGGGVLF